MASSAADAKKLAEAQKLAKEDPGRAVTVYNEVLSKDPGSSDAALRNYELALMGLGELYRDQR